MFPSGFVDIITDQKNECRLEWASLFDTEKLLGKQVTVISEHGSAADPALTWCWCCPKRHLRFNGAWIPVSVLHNGTWIV